MSRLEGKVAIVTGGASGIGAAIAAEYAGAGASVMIVDRAPAAQIDKAVSAAGGRTSGLQGDVTDMSFLREMAQEAKKRYGGIDIFVANAGVVRLETLEQLTEEAFDLVFAVNVKAHVFGVQSALEFMRPGGSIILTGSVMSIRGWPGHTAYSASKAAVRSIARTWAQELKEWDIRVNVISPGAIHTPLLVDAGADPVVSPHVYEEVTKTLPLGRYGMPSEIAKAALFLASSEASYVTGAELSVDGGLCQI